MPSARGGDTADPQACKRQSPSALDGSSLLPAAPIHFTFGLPLYSERDEVLHGDARKAQHARVRQRQSSRARCVARSPCPSGGVESQRKCQLRASCHSNLCCLPQLSRRVGVCWPAAGRCAWILWGWGFELQPAAQLPRLPETGHRSTASTAWPRAGRERETKSGGGPHASGWRQRAALKLTAAGSSPAFCSC